VILGLLYGAINGEEGSRYHGMVTQNSRCVTVKYDDGTTIDLMPVARIAGQPERAGHLFHFKKETGETAHKLYGDRVRLFARRGFDWSDRIVKAMAALCRRPPEAHVATPSMSISDTLGGRYQAAVGVGAFCSMRFCRFSSAQNSSGIVASMELTLARTCASVCAPTINAAATSGAAEN
jgi:hypothetical protein